MTAHATYETLIVERRGPVGWLINNRPDQLNAMNSTMRDEFAVAWAELEADADIVIASSDATFVDPHVSVGQVSAFEVIALARMSPMEPIVRMALAGRHERITAGRAHQLGIVSQVVDPPEQLRAEAQALGEKIARNAPDVLASVKRALWNALETT